MSHSSKSFHKSAYQMYPSRSTRNRSDSSDSENSGGDNKRRQSDWKRDHTHSTHSSGLVNTRGNPDYDSDDEVLKGYNGRSNSKSLKNDVPSMRFVNSKSKQKAEKSQQPFRKSRHKEDGRVSSHQSLMAIDFSRDRMESSDSRYSAWTSSHQDRLSGEDGLFYGQPSRKREWRSSRKIDRYSDSEEEDSSRYWETSHRNRERNRRSDVIELNSVHAPLIVDMPQRSINRISKGPRPLLESHSSTSFYTKRRQPVSLLDLTETPNGNRRQLKELEEQGAQKSTYYENTFGSDRQARKHDNRSKSERGQKMPIDARGFNEESEEPVVKKQKIGRTKSERQARVSTPAQHIKRRLIICRSNTGHIFLVLPSWCSSVCLHGRVKLTVLKGRVTILACELKEGIRYSVFSPASGSLLSLQADETCRISPLDVKAQLYKVGVSEKDKDLEHVTEDALAVLRLDKLESVTCEYLTSFIPYTQLFVAPAPSRDLDPDSLKGVTVSKIGLKIAPAQEMGQACMNMSEDFQAALDKWTKLLEQRKISQVSDCQYPVLVTCGAKNAGKSVFNRMAINTSLKSVDVVAYLDCDVGQSEFSPPATISLHVLDKPVLGPAFCSQRHAERVVFYGEISPSQEPTLYVKCLLYVLEAYQERARSMPLIVNTMGFPEGIGLMLFVDTMQAVQPDLVVQIESFNQAANFPAITQELVALEEGWTRNKTPARNEDARARVEETKAHELILLSTLVSQRRDFTFKLKAGDLRNLTLLSALSIGLEKGMTLTSLPPYPIPFRLLAVFVCHHRLSGEEMLLALDASVVALCHADLSLAKKEKEELPSTFDEMPLCECLGMGLVRAVDRENGLLYLVTTLCLDRLRQVNTLLKGALAVPDQLFLKQKSSGSLPYVDALAPSTAVTSVRPRSRMPRSTFRKN